jgi:heptosyltransferase-2
MKSVKDNSQKHILIRLPNWVGDVIMALPFIDAVKKTFPEHLIHVVIKKGLEDIIAFTEGIDTIYTYSKKEYKGLIGGYKFGKQLSKKFNYEFFYCLPNSFSSAWIGYFTQSKNRIGFKNEMRNFLLSEACAKPTGQHRVNDYLHLLKEFSNIDAAQVKSSLHLTERHSHVSNTPVKKNLLLNINSEAFSRRIPVESAASLLLKLGETNNYTIYLSGSNKEIPYVKEVLNLLPEDFRIENWAGRTSLKELFELVGSMDFVVSTDSGIAHIANAFGVNTVVIFGAGDERNTRPFNSRNLKIIRKPDLECAPCVSNKCIFQTPKCISELNMERVVTALQLF